MTLPGAREVRAPRGTQITARSWQTEAPLRMLMNNLDPEVAERPDDLVVYGGTGRAARSWAAYDAIIKTLTELAPDETLLVQSGKPVGVFRTHEWAPRVLIANSNLVGDWANWPEFRRLEAEGLMMYGQMTAGSWIYIATQGILQGTFETFAAIARRSSMLLGRIPTTHPRRHPHSSPEGVGAWAVPSRWPSPSTRAPAFVVDVDRTRLERRTDQALSRRGRDPTWIIALSSELQAAKRGHRAACPWDYSAMRPMSSPKLLRQPPSRPDHASTSSPTRPVPTTPSATLPSGIDSWRTGLRRPRGDPGGLHQEGSGSRWPPRSQAMVEFQDEGAEVFDYGNSIRDEARHGWLHPRLRLPGLRPGLHPPALLRRVWGPSGGWRSPAIPADIAVTDAGDQGALPRQCEHLHRWIDAAGEYVEFEGLPARICWLGYGERHRAGLLFNELVRTGKVKCADRDRPRPPRLRVRGLALSRDRGTCSMAQTPSPTGRCSTP
jgi:urocanate hydratase